MPRLNIGDRVQCGRGTAEAVLGEIVEICETALGVVAVVRDDDGRRHIVQVGRLAKVNDCFAWDDWPMGLRAPEGIPALRLVDGIPIHEPEPGLLDEEILDLKADWLKGPRKPPEQTCEYRKSCTFCGGCDSLYLCKHALKFTMLGSMSLIKPWF